MKGPPGVQIIQGLDAVVDHDHLVREAHVAQGAASIKITSLGSSSTRRMRAREVSGESGCTGIFVLVVILV